MKNVSEAKKERVTEFENVTIARENSHKHKECAGEQKGKTKSNNVRSR